MYELIILFFVVLHFKFYFSEKSLNEAVATVSLKNMSVVIKAIEVGTTTIVVTDNYTKQTKEIGVKVITPKQGGNHSGGKGGKKN